MFERSEEEKEREGGRGGQGRGGRDRGGGEGSKGKRAWPTIAMEMLTIAVGMAKGEQP